MIMILDEWEEAEWEEEPEQEQERREIVEWHRLVPKCGYGGCDETPCTHARTCRCVGGSDTCEAAS